MCLRHSPAGDATKQPQLNLGKCYASPRKESAPKRSESKKRC